MRNTEDGFWDPDQPTKKHVVLLLLCVPLLVLAIRRYLSLSEPSRFNTIALCIFCLGVLSAGTKMIIYAIKQRSKGKPSEGDQLVGKENAQPNASNARPESAKE